MEIFPNMQKKNTEINIMSLLYKLVFLIFVFYFRVFGGLAYFSVYPRTGRIRNFWVVSIFIILWVLWKIITKNYRFETPFDKEIIILLLIVLLSTIFSKYQSYSIERFVGFCVYVLLFYILFDFCINGDLSEHIIDAVILSFGFITFVGVWIIFLWVNIFYGNPVTTGIDISLLLHGIPRLSILSDPNTLSVSILLLFPLGIYWYQKKSSLIWKILLPIIGICTLLVFIFSRSRGALIGLAFMMLAFIIVERRFIFGFLRGDIYKISVAVFLILLTVLVFGYVIVERGFSFQNSLTGRIEAWKVAMKVIQENPILGSGMGSFGTEFLRLRNPLNKTEVLPHPHNELLTIGTQLGLLGILGFSILGVKYIRFITDTDKIVDKELSKACFLGMFGFMGHSLVDSFSDRPIIVILVIFLVVLTISIDKELELKSNVHGIPIIFIFIVFIGMLSWRIIWKLEPYYQARTEVEKGNFIEALGHIGEAIKRDPKNPYYYRVEAILKSQIICNQDFFIPGKSHGHDISQNIFRGWSPDHAVAAAVLANEGYDQKALSEMKKAVNYHPLNGSYHCQLGQYHQRVNNFKAALIEYETCLSLDPGLIESPFWKNDSFRSQSFYEIISNTEMRIKESKLLSDENSFINLCKFYLTTGNIEKFEGCLYKYDKELSGVTKDILKIKSLYLQNEYDDALHLIEQTLPSKPRSGGMWNMIARIYMNNNNWQKAGEALQISLFINNRNPETHYIFGRLEEINGEQLKAIKSYKEAIRNAEINNDGNFSFRVARRYPIVYNNNSCINLITTYDKFMNPALALASLLDDAHCDQITLIYSDILETNSFYEELISIYKNMNCKQ